MANNSLIGARSTSFFHQDELLTLNDAYDVAIVLNVTWRTFLYRPLTGACSTRTLVLAIVKASPGSLTSLRDCLPKALLL